MSRAAQPIEQPLGPPLDGFAGKHRVGPNAIIQTSRVLDELCGKQKRDIIFQDAGFGWMGRREPHDMVRAEAVVALNASIRRHLPRVQAERVMWHAGVETARYILANRIPRFAQWLLGRLPPRLAVRLLLKAVGRNAWTFAGAATVRVGGNWIRIDDNPLCLGRSGFSACIWHEAVFTTLFETIIGRAVFVHETHCMARGDNYCRFEIELG